MIPKILHYCWFGGRPLCELSKKCLASWQRHCPEFEVMYWHEGNIDLDHPFISHYIRRKQWAFVSDFVRLQKVREHGGVYLDTDFEIIRPLDSLLHLSCFLGEEKIGRLNSGILGAEPDHPFLAHCLELMRNRHDSGQPFLIAPEVCTRVYSQYPEKVDVLPPEVFYPFNPYNEIPGNAQLMYCDITGNTYAIHHWAKSWRMPLHLRIRRGIGRLLDRSFRSGGQGEPVPTALPGR